MEPQLAPRQRPARQPECSGAGHGRGVFTPLPGPPQEAPESCGAQAVNGRRKWHDEEHHGGRRGGRYRGRLGKGREEEHTEKAIRAMGRRFVR